VVAPEKTAPAVLPNTSGDEMMPYLIGLVGALVAGAVAVRLAVSVYARHKRY
jgi:hypothetical protein